MKANELMIGDWVDFYKSPFADPHYYGKVICLDRYDVICNPIPLTPEILEKNGFEISGEYGECVADGLFVDVPIWSYEAEDIYISWAGVELSISYNLGMPCNEIKLYQPKVHELQHALRLCGLNDLVDNFKV